MNKNLQDRPRYSHSLWAVLASLALGSFLFAQDRGPERILAMADIHGNLETAVGLLESADVVDADGDWIGGRDTFIQTGDFTDRGPQVRRVMDFLMALIEDAPEGRVVVLLGNHEMLNIIGNLNDVTVDDFASFTDSGSERRRQSALQQHFDYLENRAERLGLAPPVRSSEFERGWLDAHPPGLIEHRNAFSPEGRYGRWLRTLPVLVKREDVLFLHAGVHPTLSALTIDEINSRVQDEIRTFDALKQYLVDQGLALPFFTLDEIAGSVSEELEARRAILSAAMSDAEEGGRAYEPSESEARHIEILEAFLDIGNWLTLHPDGILWFRGYAQWPETTGSEQVGAILERYNARHFVVGHTPQPQGKITVRFDGRVFLADTGMLSSFYAGGRGSMLEIREGVFRAVYANGETEELFP